MRLDSLGRPYLVQAIENSGKPPANLLGERVSLKETREPAEESPDPPQEQSLGRVLEFISRHRKQQKRDPKERGKIVVQEYKRVEKSLEAKDVAELSQAGAKGQNLNIKA
jgi:hypothetical protein